MPNAKGHLLERAERRVYGGEPWGSGLITWLEKNRERARGRRIQLLLREMREITGTLEDPVYGYTQTGIPTTIRRARSREAAVRNERLALRVNRRLRHYRLWPELIFGIVRRSPSKWRARWHAEGERSRTPDTLSEADAVLRILRLAESGYVDRVRECAECDRWFFARFRHARFCSPACQQRNYRESPEWKERRNAYMRDYYQKNLASEGQK